MPRKISKFAYLYWFLAAFFYFYQYVLRVSTGVVTDNLMLEFDITASTLGTIMGLSSIAYVIFQIPAGSTTDYFGVKRLLPLSILVCAFGAFLFGSAQDMVSLLISRVLLGGASAFAFIGAAKIISLYFPERRMAAMVSLTILVGSAGGVIGVGPLAFLINNFGWRVSILWVAMLGGALSIALYMLGRQQRQPLNKKVEAARNVSLLTGIKKAISTPQVLVICAWSFCIYMPLCVFADAWGVPYIMSALALPKPIAASHISLIYIGLLFGCPFYGWIGTRSSNYRAIFFLSTFGLLICFSFLLWGLPLNIYVMDTLLFTVGFLNCVQLLMFPGAVRHTSTEFTGSVVGVVNTATMLSGAVFQKMVGVGLDYFWDGQRCDGVPVYSTRCYQIPLSVILVMMALGTCVALFIKAPRDGGKHSGFHK